MITNELLAHMSYADLVNKNEVRQQLEKEVEQFLEKNKVTELKGCELKPRPKRSTVESPKVPYVSDLKVNRLVQWCNESKTKKPRRTLVSELTGIGLSRIRSTLTTGARARLTFHEYKLIDSCKAQVEKLELDYQTKPRIKAKAA